MADTRRGCFLQFAKAAREGFVKTRLQPAYSAAEAASIARLLTETVASALASIPDGWQARLCADDPADEFLRALAARHGRQLRAQGSGDLGQRMARAIAEALGDFRAVIVVGSDCPAYDPDYLRAATQILEHRDAVLGPAQDGGYVLIGLTRLEPALFEGPVWGSEQVLAAQRARLAGLGYSWEELAARADIDRPEDVARWLREGADQARAIGRLSP